MTEDKAKQKWCPMMRVGMVHGMSVNVHPSDYTPDSEGVDKSTRCQASGCMMWRWIPRMEGLQGEVTMPPKHGYCGLSGKPTLVE